MPRSLGILLTLALMLPAALLPQGVRLAWCWCPGVGSTCCGVEEVASCCSSGEHGHDDARQRSREDGLQRRPDCDACHELQVDPNPGPVVEGGVTPVHVLALWERVDARHARPAAAERSVARAPRAPPGGDLPQALRPGSAPLRL